MNNKNKMSRNTNRATGNEIQRTDFLSSLREKLGKIASVHSKVYSSAQEYLSQGFSRPETEELLSIDGYDPDLVKTCMASLDSVEHAPSSGKRWGFTVEDFYGRIASHVELNATIFAESEDEAMEKAEEFVSNADAEEGMERIVDVFELD